MKLVLMNNVTGTIEIFKSKEDLISFAQDKLKYLGFGVNKHIDKVLRDDDHLTIAEVCEALKNEYKRII